MTHPDPSHSQEQADLEADTALHNLLGRAKVAQLSPGFTFEVIRSVECAEQASTEFPCAGAHQITGTPRFSSWLARVSASGAVAAALAVAAGLALWQTERSAESAPSADDPLISALQSLDLKSEDFAIVTQLGEVLEAELTANNALWPEPK